MCGICGIYGIKDEALVKRMVSSLRHRGPDDSGIYTDDNISLGHARLSVIDLTERGRQPMSNEDGNIWLSVNGEIYNFMKLRAELEKKGHRFYSKADSEVIVHAYEEHGLDFVNKLRGMFALALYDKRQNRLILARDPIGKKPLYYHFDGKLLIFASEIKAILEAGVNREIDEVALYAYLAYQYSLGERTLFKDIKKLPAGNVLILEPAKLSIRRYWDIEENIGQASDNYFIEKLRALLEESVKLRMVADVPVGAFLSGGIDSAAVVALARQYAEDEFHTFSVGFETFSELEYAKIVSQHLNTVHHELLITADMVVQDLPKIAWHYDEPVGDAATINNYYLSREARKYVKVVVAGEGGDELFAGYANYKTNLRYFNLFRLPPQMRKAAKAVLNLTPGKGNIHTAGDRIHRLASFLCQPTFQSAHLYTTTVMSDAEINYLTKLCCLEIDNLAITPSQIMEPLNKMLALDCKNLLPEKFLMKADKATMANSVEERLPLLDKQIIEFAFCMPPRLKISHGQEKYILRKAVYDLLPPEIVNRPKVGFGTPLVYWMRQRPLKEMVIDRLSNGELINNYFKKAVINEIINNLEQGNIDRAYKANVVWTIFALELWYDTYF